MPLDRCARCLRKLETEVLEAGPEGGVVRGRELRGVTDARRERLAPAIQSVRLLGLRTTQRGTAPGVDSSRTDGDDRPVFRDPSGSWPGLPEPLVDRVTLASPQCGMGPYGPGPGTVNPLIHEVPDGARFGG